jgi:hypothetical protein
MLTFTSHHQLTWLCNGGHFHQRLISRQGKINGVVHSSLMELKAQNNINKHNSWCINLTFILVQRVRPIKFWGRVKRALSSGYAMRTPSTSNTEAVVAISLDDKARGRKTARPATLPMILLSIWPNAWKRPRNRPNDLTKSSAKRIKFSKRYNQKPAASPKCRKKSNGFRLSYSRNTQTSQL